MDLAADANVLWSAVIDGRARLVLSHRQVQNVFTTEHTFAEVEEYALVLARKKRLPSDILLLAVAALPVAVVSRTQYAKSIAAATKLIARRDPDDVELLALAIHLRIPIWSNDKDFDSLHTDLSQRSVCCAILASLTSMDSRCYAESQHYSLLQKIQNEARLHAHLRTLCYRHTHEHSCRRNHRPDSSCAPGQDRTQADRLQAQRAG